MEKKMYIILHLELMSGFIHEILMCNVKTFRKSNCTLIGIVLVLLKIVLIRIWSTVCIHSSGCKATN